MDTRAVYERLKPRLEAQYPAGRFVGVVDGEVVADAPTFLELVVKLAAIEPRPDRRLVVQVGADYPASAVIRRRRG